VTKPAHPDNPRSERPHDTVLERFRTPRRYTRHDNTKEHHKVIDKVRQILRRLDRWTLTVFNPYYASDHRH
jgi:hypothetical protein